MQHEALRGGFLRRSPLQQALTRELECASQARPGYSKEREQLEDRQGRMTVCGILELG